MNKLLQIDINKLNSIGKNTKTNKYWIPVDKDTGEVFASRYSKHFKEGVKFISSFEFQGRLCIRSYDGQGYFTFIREDEKHLEKPTEIFLVHGYYIIDIMNNMNDGVIEGKFTLYRTKGGGVSVKLLI